MAFDGGIVHYNYAAMNAVASALHGCGGVAQSLLDTGRANRATLAASFTGDSSTQFQASFAKYEQVCQNTIDVTMRGAHAYDNGTTSMLANEHQVGAAFPG
jgi:uncharacterized protein YukE